MSARWLWFAGLALALLACETRGATAVWIDSDPSIGPPWREVDDAFALLLAFHSPEVRIAGISTTYGNVGLARTTAVARDLVRRFGRPAGLTARDVSPGAGAPGDFRQTAASDALARALRQERLTYIALGPLTNLAAFLKLHPRLAQRIDKVIFVGGVSPGYTPAFGPTSALRIHDANVVKDPGATAGVLAASLPIVLAPVEISRQLAITPEDLRQLRASGPPGEFLARRTRAWIWFWTRLVGERGGLVFDVFAILPAIGGDLLATETRYATLRGNELVAHQQRRPNARLVRFGVEVRGGTHTLVVRRLQGRGGMNGEHPPRR